MTVSFKIIESSNLQILHLKSVAKKFTPKNPQVLLEELINEKKKIGSLDVKQVTKANLDDLSIYLQTSMRNIEVSKPSSLFNIMSDVVNPSQSFDEQLVANDLISNSQYYLFQFVKNNIHTYLSNRMQIEYKKLLLENASEIELQQLQEKYFILVTFYKKKFSHPHYITYKNNSIELVTLTHKNVKIETKVEQLSPFDLNNNLATQYACCDRIIIKIKSNSEIHDVVCCSTVNGHNVYVLYVSLEEYELFMQNAGSYSLYSYNQHFIPNFVIQNIIQDFKPITVLNNISNDAIIGDGNLS